MTLAVVTRGVSCSSGGLREVCGCCTAHRESDSCVVIPPTTLTCPQVTWEHNIREGVLLLPVTLSSSLDTAPALGTQLHHNLSCVLV